MSFIEGIICPQASRTCCDSDINLEECKVDKVPKGLPSKRLFHEFPKETSGRLQKTNKGSKLIFQKVRNGRNSGQLTTKGLKFNRFEKKQRLGYRRKHSFFPIKKIKNTWSSMIPHNNFEWLVHFLLTNIGLVCGRVLLKLVSKNLTYNSGRLNTEVKNIHFQSVKHTKTEIFPNFCLIIK